MGRSHQHIDFGSSFLPEVGSVTYFYWFPTFSNILCFSNIVLSQLGGDCPIIGYLNQKTFLKEQYFFL